MSLPYAFGRRRFIVNSLAVGASILLPNLAWAGASRLTQVQLSAAPEHIRLDLTLHPLPHYRIFTLAQPARLVIDLAQTENVTDLTALTHSGYFQSVRWAKHGAQTLRLVLEFRANTDIHYQAIPAGERLRLTINRPFPQRLPDAEKRRDIVVVIDPGHGGKDPGATGKGGTHEKNVVLAIARKLKRRIDQTPGFRAVMTRNSDTFIPLQGRVRIAHRHKADVFVSVHADACQDRRVTGSSVYILSEKGASSVMARRLADRENSADLIGGISLKTKDKVLAKVLLDLSQTSTLSASAKLADALIGTLAQHEKALHRDIERAAFAVLKSPDIPSVLVETAFISNPREERRLRTSAFQNQIAQALHQGLTDYCHRHIPSHDLRTAALARPRLTAKEPA